MQKLHGILVMAVIFITGLGFCSSQDVVTRFFNTTVQRGETVELHLVSFDQSALSLTCSMNPSSAKTFSVAYYDKTTSQLKIATTIPSHERSRVAIKNKMIIVISGITFEDEKSQLQCSSFQLKGGELITTYGPRYEIISVQEPPRISGLALKDSYTGKEETSMQLNCSFTGRPLEEAKWSGPLSTIGVQKKTEVAVANNLTEVTLTLSIARLDAIHNRYEGICSTKNFFRSVQQRTTLNVTFAPKNASLTITPSDVKEHINITMHCTATVNPPYIVYDFYRGTKLVTASFTGHYTFSSSNCSADSGNYTCVPRGTIGQDSTATKYLSIYGSPKASVPSQKVTLNEGNTFDMTCSAAGCPTPNISWYRVGVTAPLVNAARLELRDLKPSDEGQYTCKAYNQKEQDTVMVQLEVNYAPKNTTLNISPAAPKEGDTITLTCATTAKPPATAYRYYRNNVQVHSDSKGIFQILATNCTVQSGLYRCTPQNTLGTDSSAELNVFVYGPPKIKVVTPRLEAVEKTNVTLQCLTFGCPIPNITWYREGSTTIIGRGSRLHLLNIQPDTAGKYKCMASNQKENTSSTAELAVRYPPKTASLNTVGKDLKEDTNITFKCQARAYPAIHTYLFYHKSKLVQNSSSDTYVFYAKDCAAESGQYRCIPINDMGRESTASHTISIYGPPKPKVPPSMARFAVNEGKDVTLTCTVKGCPLPDISWYKDGQSKVLATGSSLTLTKLRPQDTGTYRCVAYNTKENKSDISVLAVNFYPRNLSITTNMAGGYLEEGKELVVTCSSDAYPKARYNISRDNTMLAHNTTGIFKQPKTNCSIHSGTYVCDGYNMIGSAKTPKSQKVIIEGKPTFTLIPLSITTNESNSVTFTCAAVGCPSPEINWFKAGKSVTNGNGTQLTFTKAQRTEDGSYTCEAKNSRGTIKSKFNFAVQYRATGTDFKAKSTTVVAGSKVELTCTAVGKPSPVYSFHKRSTITPLTEVKSASSVTTGVLVIDKMPYDKSYRTVYGCTPKNLLGDAMLKELTVEIEVAPLNQKIVPSDKVVERKEASALNLKCTVEYSNPKASITWTKVGDKKSLSSLSDLNFAALKRTDSGTYQCKVTNKLGSLTQDVKLNVTFAPSVSASVVTEFNVCIDTLITLECFGVGNPVPKAEIKQGTQVLASTMQKATHTMTIIMERYGDYTCVLTNKHGTVSKTIKVQKQVLPGSPVVTINPVDNTLVIKWTTPKCTGQAGVKSFIIYYRGKNDKEESKKAVECDQPACEHTLKNLDEKTTYEVSVVAVDKNGKEGKKQFVQGIETKAAVAAQKSGKLSGTTVTFIIIGAIVVFLLAVALFVLMRRRSLSDGTEVSKSASPKRERAAPNDQTVIKIDNVANINEADGKDTAANGHQPNGSGGGAIGNEAFSAEEDEDIDNVPSEEIVADTADEVPEEAAVAAPEAENGAMELGEINPAVEEEEKEVEKEIEKEIEKEVEEELKKDKPIPKKRRENIYETVQRDDV